MDRSRDDHYQSIGLCTLIMTEATLYTGRAYTPGIVATAGVVKVTVLCV